MRFTRRTLAAALALASVAGFASNASAADPKPKVALVMKSLANEFFRTMEDGAKAHQKAHASDYTLVANGIKDETDTAAQIKMVEQMVAQRVQAIVIAPADSKALVVIGIGGSYLGARAVVELLKSPNYNALPKATPDIYFAGNGISSDAVTEILTMIGDRDFSVNVISKSGTTTEPAIAFITS